MVSFLERYFVESQPAQKSLQLLSETIDMPSEADKQQQQQQQQQPQQQQQQQPEEQRQEQKCNGTPTATAAVTRIAIFPIKSCGVSLLREEEKQNKKDFTFLGFAIFSRLFILSLARARTQSFNPPRWSITNRGFAFDREWMLVDLDGANMTQKKVQ